jgi:putative transcriptional regulator
MELLDFKKLNKLKPKKGRVLISEPFLDDDFFKRSVVLLCEHNEEGTFGFVLTNYAETKLSDLMNDFPDFESKISVGGPVKNDNLYYVHTVGDKIEGSIQIGDGIYMGGSFQSMQNLIEAGELKENEIRFFVGYSGWGLGQLEIELKDSAWIVAEAATADLMDTHIENLWKKLLGDMGENQKLFSTYPEDPSLN